MSVPFYFLRCSAAIAVLGALCGCAVRFEDAQGNTWVGGVSKRSVEVMTINSQTLLVKERWQAAPLEFAVLPSGVESSVGMAQGAAAYLVSRNGTNTFREVAGVGLSALPAAAPAWRFGVFHSRVPASRSPVRIVASTLRGGTLRLAEDPFLKVGFARTTFAEVAPNTSLSLSVDYDFASSVPDLKLTDLLEHHENH